MSLKSEREKAADELNAKFAREGGSSSYEIEKALRAAEKRAMERVMDWIDCEGGDQTLEAGLPIPINQLLDEEVK